MKFRKTIILLLMCIICIFSSCNSNLKTNTKTSKKETVKHVSNTKPLSEVRKYEIKNYDNFFTSEDKKYIYCIDSYGLYKTSKSDNTSNRLVEFYDKNINYGYCLTLHNDYIYFTKCNYLFRIKKDGSNYYKFSNIKQKITSIKCIDNKLYVNGCDFKYCYDIGNDSKSPKTICNYNKLPTLDNKVYFTECKEINMRLYSADEDGSNPKAILDNVDNYYIYNNKVFYLSFDNSNLYVCDTNGKGSKVIYKMSDQFNLKFLDFDNNWLYIYEPSSTSGNKHTYKRINIKTKEVQHLDKICCSNNNQIDFFEINNDYIFTRELGHAKYIKCDGSGGWKDINF